MVLLIEGWRVLNGSRVRGQGRLEGPEFDVVRNELEGE